MKISILFLLVVSSGINPQRGEQDVYICFNNKTERYHLDKDCRGLKKCTHTIKKITLKAALSEGRTLCGFEK